MIFSHASFVEHSLTGALMVAALCLYLTGWVQNPLRKASNAVGFASGVSIAFIALTPWLESMAGRTFTAHMIQHLLIYAVVPPLIVMSAPIATMGAVLPLPMRRIMHRLPRVSRSSPLLATAATVLTLYALHLSALYDVALGNNPIHAATHLALFSAGLLVWNVGLKPGVQDGPVRFGVAITMSVPIAVLGVILTSADKPLSQHYSVLLGQREALADQHAGGALMWIGAMIAGAGLVVATLWRWASLEQAVVERRERLHRADRSY